MDAASQKYRLNIDPEWQEVEPRSTGYTVLTDKMNLLAHSTNFEIAKDLGYVSGVNCPIAVDQVNKIAYRSVRKSINDASGDSADGNSRGSDEICSFDLRSGKSSLVTTLPEGLGCIWLLEFLPSENTLIAFFIEHKKQPQKYLGTINLVDGSITSVPIPDNAFYPAAVCLEQKQIVFSGRLGGAVIIDFNGDTVGTLEPGPFYNLEGAGFIGNNGDVVLGGNGLHVWNPESAIVNTLFESGSYPVADGKGRIWFNASDGAVSYSDHQGKGVRNVVSLNGLDLIETGFASTAVFSSDKRIIFSRLTGKRRLSCEEIAEKERRFKKNSFRLLVSEDKYAYVQYFCVLDTKERVLWKYPGYAHNVAVLSGDYYDT